MEMTCKKCKSNTFTIDELVDCDDCEYNGWMSQESDYWEYGPMPNNEVIRQAENDGECKMGNNHNFGCWLVKCTGCGHIINLPMVEE